MRRVVVVLASLAACGLMLTLPGCKHDPPDPLDLDLLRLAEGTGPRRWYHDSNEPLGRSAGSGHPEALLRTWYNETAMAHLDANARVTTGTVFPDGSLIVKELFAAPGDLVRYAILYKQHDHPNADGDGWVWSEIRPGGAVTSPSHEHGSACRGCHGQDGNIDFTLMNKAFP